MSLLLTQKLGWSIHKIDEIAVFSFQRIYFRTKKGLTNLPTLLKINFQYVISVNNLVFNYTVLFKGNLSKKLLNKNIKNLNENKDNNNPFEASGFPILKKVSEKP